MTLPTVIGETSSKFARVSTASFRGERGDATVRLPADFPIKEGAQLAKSCFVGKLIGEGIQGAVYDLVEEHGRPLNLVLKAVGSSATAWLSSILPSMEREWAIGQRLAMHCTTPAGLHPGFMRVGAALIVEQPVRERSKSTPGSNSRNGQGVAKPRVKGRFRGMVLEKLSGRTLADILGSKRRGLQDIHYLRQALMQVLTALAVAQKLGFRHWDLRMKNIMEHHPPAAARADDSLETASKVAAAAQDMPAQPGHMKSDSQESGDASAEAWSMIDLADGSSRDDLRGQENQCNQQNNGSYVSAGKERGAGGTAGGEGLGKRDDCVWKIIDYGHADFGDKMLQYDGLCVEGPPFDPNDGLPKWMLESGLPEIPLAEKCYRVFWWRKGDVYRMLMSLQNVIDGSTWPQEDRQRVNELVGLIHHVTGKRITAYFTGEQDGAHSSCGLRFWRRSEGWCHAGRKWQMRVQSFVAPYNPGITAAEALALPFFSRQE